MTSPRIRTVPASYHYDELPDDYDVEIVPSFGSLSQGTSRIQLSSPSPSVAAFHAAAAASAAAAARDAALRAEIAAVKARTPPASPLRLSGSPSAAQLQSRLSTSYVTDAPVRVTTPPSSPAVRRALTGLNRSPLAAAAGVSSPPSSFAVQRALTGASALVDVASPRGSLLSPSPVHSPVSPALGRATAGMASFVSERVRSEPRLAVIQYRLAREAAAAGVDSPLSFHSRISGSVSPLPATPPPK